MPLDLKRLFFGEGQHLNFFQAAYLLERLYEGRGRSGTGDDLRSESVRFETLNSLGFPGSDVAAILPPLSLQGQAEANSAGKDAVPIDLEALPALERLPEAGRGPLRMALTFMGLYGVSSPLPSYFVDPITLRKVEYFELKKFLDIFAHRFYSLFYRSWKKYRHFAQFRPDLPDDFTLRLLALTGQWPRKPVRSALAAPRPGRGPSRIAPAAAGPTPSAQSHPFDLRRIPYARFLGNRVRSAKGLQQMLRGYFGFPKVRIVQFAPAWVDIPVLTRLGSAEVVLGASTRLGHRMEDLLSRFIVEIGPLPRGWFNRFLPSSGRLLGPFRNGVGGPKGLKGLTGLSDGGLDDRIDPLGAASSEMLARVKDLIDTYLRDPLDYEVRIILEPDPGRPPALGEEHARLGMGIWLGARPAGQVACRL